MKEIKVGKKYIYFGRLRGFSVGISIDKYCIDISLFKYYIGMEL
jgi:hypothetical protein